MFDLTDTGNDASESATHNDAPNSGPDTLESLLADDGDGSEGAGEGGKAPGDAEEWGDDDAEDDDKDQDDDAEDEPVEGKPEGHRVPISRLKKEAEKRRALAAELETLKAEVASLRGTQGQPQAQQAQHDPSDRYAGLRKADPDVAKIEAWIAQHDPNKLNPDDFPTQGDYARAVTAAQANRNEGLLELRARQNRYDLAQEAKASQAHAAEVAYFEKLGARYDAALAASKIPGVATYAKNIADRAAQLAPEIQRAILEHPEPDVIAAALGSSREIFREFAAASKKGVTSATMMRLGEVVAAYKAKAPKGGSEPAPAPQKPQEPPRRRPNGGNPAQTDSRGGTLSLGNRSMSEIRKELGLY